MIAAIFTIHLSKHGGQFVLCLVICFIQSLPSIGAGQNHTSGRHSGRRVAPSSTPTSVTSLPSRTSLLHFLHLPFCLSSCRLSYILDCFHFLLSFLPSLFSKAFMMSARPPRPCPPLSLEAFLVFLHSPVWFFPASP